MIGPRKSGLNPNQRAREAAITRYTSAPCVHPRSERTTMSGVMPQTEVPCQGKSGTPGGSSLASPEFPLGCTPVHTHRLPGATHDPLLCSRVISGSCRLRMQGAHGRAKDSRTASQGIAMEAAMTRGLGWLVPVTKEKPDPTQGHIICRYKSSLAPPPLPVESSCRRKRLKHCITVAYSSYPDVSTILQIHCIQEAR